MTSPHSSRPWWRDAVIYQVYLRSFADGNGDGIGDIAGLRSRLPYLAELGVDALWLNPWYTSPQVDAGYDISDYRAIDPCFGTLDEAKGLINEAHQHGIRLILDLVPNHTSDQHRWFQEALSGGPGSPARRRYHVRPGQGPRGSEPPNNWPSIFGGPAWTRTTDPDGTPGDWYLHLFAPEQPDLNWDHPEVRAEFEDVLRFWLDLGVDGFRIDVAHGLTKDPAYPDLDATDSELLGSARTEAHPYFDRDETLAIYQDWRRMLDSYDGERLFVAEAWVSDATRTARYLTPDRLHTAFNFGLLGCPWDAEAFRSEIEQALRVLDGVGAPATWVLSNHDVVRHVTRYGRQDTSLQDAKRHYGSPVDLTLGERRARAAVQLVMALPGGAYVYQGEELGLPEVENLPPDTWQDPSRHWSDHPDPVRDGCRVPLPWSGAAPPFGFSPDDAHARPWLPQPRQWKDRTVAAQLDDPGSMLAHYRAVLRHRKQLGDFADGTPLTWLPAPNGVLAFRRGDVVCITNLSRTGVPLPPDQEILLASTHIAAPQLPPDTTVWLSAQTDRDQRSRSEPHHRS
ncbi:glycoside hydrolase family 13 protein [Streptomyces sp. RB6PN25]|uniref:Glycoside hydrolase family 13 protein n=1 Tax=Streptomyces humicola TaxID=2953240 RepID=A0ABT1Q2B9_9ACTN|nr:glycoside hydrolase family 13 protein [Streptomyces humicola]MCQ4084064.1 glycoside hydrolase family 13 protein [Streptomyces humicola]